MATQDYDNVSNPSNVEGKRRAWKRNFNGTSLNTDAWAVSGSFPGMTYSVAAGALTVNMGVGINEELVITSTASFQIPFRVQFHHSMAQRIANNEVYLEMVNATGDTYTGWMFDGTTTTLAKTVHANGGNSSPASPTGTVTVTATAATTVIREINAHMEAIDFTDRGADTNTAATPRVTKTRTTFDPDERYFIRMRFKNTGVAPATNTVSTVENVLVQDTNDLLVEVSAGRGDNSGSRSVPVTVNGTAAVSMATNTPSLSVSATVGTAATNTRFPSVTNAGQSVKGSAGKFFGVNVSNWGASAAWFNIYNATSVVIGTTVPVIQLLVPAGQTIILDQEVGVTMSTGIFVAATDTSALQSAVAPATALQASVRFI
jgi:hypothetical protein